MAELLAYMTQTGLLDEAELQDPVYDAYCQRVNEPVSCEALRGLTAEWDRLNEIYKQECEPAFLQSASDPTQDILRRATELLNAMVFIENILGY